MLSPYMSTLVVNQVVTNFFLSVPPGYVGCIYDRGRGVLRETYKPGLHFKIPFWQKAKLFNTQIQEYPIKRGFDTENEELFGDKEILALTADDKPVSIQATVLFRIAPHHAGLLWDNIGQDFVRKIIRPLTRSRFRMVISHYPQSVVLTRNQEIELAVERELIPAFERKSLMLEDVLLSHVAPASRSLFDQH